MSNANSVPPIYISVTSESNQEDLSLQILFICLPIIFVPLVGLTSWFIRGHYDRQRHALAQHKEDKKKYLIENIQNQIKLFYWPLYLNLIRYQQLLDRYKEFKAGHFSLSSANSPDFLKKSQMIPKPIQKSLLKQSNPILGSVLRTFENSPQLNVNKLKVDELQVNPARLHTLSNLQKQFVDNQIPIMKPISEEPHVSAIHEIHEMQEIKIDINDQGEQNLTLEQSSDTAEQTNSNSNSNSDPSKDIKPDHNTLITNPPTRGGMGISNAIKIIAKFNKAIREYENKMTQTLKDIQKIYTDSVAIADPSFELLRELVKLDEYITYITTFRDVSKKSSSDIILEEKIERAKFPSRINELIDAQLSYLQALCKDLVNNHNSGVLDSQENLTHAPVELIHGETQV